MCLILILVALIPIAFFFTGFVGGWLFVFFCIAVVLCTLIAALFNAPEPVQPDIDPDEAASPDEYPSEDYY
jgi:hypothetical protein